MTKDYALQYLPKEERLAARLLADPLLRLNNLYTIIDANGNKIRFKMNEAQIELYNNMWYCNIILKARQLGFSTFICMYFLDQCLFHANKSPELIAHTREDAEILFRRVKYAYENLPSVLRRSIPPVGDNAKELVLSNGSSLRVGTSLRSSSIQLLHISEFGPICAKYPEKADEIMAGSLNTVAPGQMIFIESTADGSDGHFYNMCMKAMQNKKKGVPLTKMDYKFLFFPWYENPKYVLDEYVHVDKDNDEYFRSLEQEKIYVGGEQKSWYIKKKEVIGDAIFAEFPSTAHEAFRASASGLFFGKDIACLRADKRLTTVPFDSLLPVYTAWDLAHGVSGYTACWFFQIDGYKINLIDFYQGSGLSLTEHIRAVRGKGYTLAEGIFPHDVEHTESILGLTRNEVITKLGIDVIVADKLLVSEGIEAVHATFPKIWMDANKCEEGLRMLENYRRDWDNRLAKWSHKPVGDVNSHGADALRMLCVGIRKFDDGVHVGETDNKALRAYWGVSGHRNEPFSHQGFTRSF